MEKMMMAADHDQFGRKILPSQASIKEALHYDPETGIFTRLSGRCKGKKVGSVHGKGYLAIGLGRPSIQYRAHRLAWVYMTGEQPTDQLDHIDCDKLNNRWSNLREATNQQNVNNVGLRRTNQSGYKGVCWVHRLRKWRATIVVGGKWIILGHYDDPELAHDIYCVAAARYHGEFLRVA